MKLIDALKAYSNSDFCPMHMPGHKRNDFAGSDLPYDIDITEIDGFDNLHESNGILKSLSDRCASEYGSKRCFMLVNGSTCGIQAAVRASVNRGDKVIVARNCHISVYNAIEVNCLNPVYISPSADRLTGISGSITPQQVKEALCNNPDAKLVILTSPTYEGIVSDVSEIARIAHEYSVPLLVDGAHGAHLGFCDEFPVNPVKCGADMVVMSLHKTLPSLTQTALLHLCSDRVDENKIEKSLSIFETSSPSYVLLASIDACMDYVENRKSDFLKYSRLLDKFYLDTIKLKHLSVLHGKDSRRHGGFFDFDKGKLIVLTVNSSINGLQLAENLRRKYKIEVEAVCSDYVIAMTSVCDSERNIERFADALIEIDATLDSAEKPPIVSILVPKMKMLPCEAAEVDFEPVMLEDSVGRVSAESVWAYPPGIPLVVPGEVISNELIQCLRALKGRDVRLHSSGNTSCGVINCVKQPRIAE